VPTPFGIGLHKIVDGINMALRNYQQVNGCLRMNISKRQYVFIFVDYVGGYAFIYDFAE
jgi:hypothetical protein